MAQLNNVQIFWSADVSKERLLETLNGDFPNENVGVKLDRLFLTKYGLATIGEVQALGIPVFADAKITEIPSKCLEIAKIHLEQHPYMLNIMSDSLSTLLNVAENENDLEALYRFAKLCKEYGVRSCAVSLFTSKPKEVVERQYGKPFDEVVAWFAGLVRDCDLTDLVCSPVEAPIYRKIVGEDVGIVTPGVRLPESDNRDQKRVTTPADAFANGATTLVIGSDLTKGNDFLGNYAKIMANINGGIK